MLTYILLDFSIPEYIISNRIVKITLFITFGIPGTYPRSISIFTCKLATCTVLIKICVEEEPEGDLIDLATEPWKTQRKTTSWHLQKSEENWVLTQADTGGKTKIQISRKLQVLSKYWTTD